MNDISATIEVWTAPVEMFFRSIVAPRSDSSSAVSDKQYKMIAFDLDGTLLNSQREISDTQVSFLRELQARGIIVAIATGRGMLTLKEHVLKLDLPGPIPVVCANGSKGFLCETMQSSSSSSSSSSPTEMKKQEIFNIPLSPEVVRKTVGLANRMKLAAIYYTDTSIYANYKYPHHHRHSATFKELTGKDLVVVEDDFEELLGEMCLPAKMQILNVPDFDPVEVELEGDATLIPGYSNILGWYVELMNSKVCKGKGLETMCNFLNIPTSACIAVGDGVNDLEFLAVAGFGLAMKNGHKMVKKAADAITEWTNDEDGVMKSLQKLERIGKINLVPAQTIINTTQ